MCKILNKVINELYLTIRWIHNGVDVKIDKQKVNFIILEINTICRKRDDVYLISCLMSISIYIYIPRYIAFMSNVKLSRHKQSGALPEIRSPANVKAEIFER